jgi:hypothetical protein
MGINENDGNDIFSRSLVSLLFFIDSSSFHLLSYDFFPVFPVFCFYFVMEIKTLFSGFFYSYTVDLENFRMASETSAVVDSGGIFVEFGVSTSLVELHYIVD